MDSFLGFVDEGLLAGRGDRAARVRAYVRRKLFERLEGTPFSDDELARIAYLSVDELRQCRTGERELTAHDIGELTVELGLLVEDLFPIRELSASDCEEVSRLNGAPVIHKTPLPGVVPRENYTLSPEGARSSIGVELFCELYIYHSPGSKSRDHR